MHLLRPGVRAMALSALAFSAMTALVKLVGTRLPSQEIVLARALVALALSWALLRRAGVPPLGTRRGLLLLRGVLGFAGLSCVFYAVTRLPLAEATVIQYLHPVFTALLAAVFLRERVGAGLAVAVATSLAGVVLVARPASLFGLDARGFEPLALAAAFGGAFASACAYVVVRRLAREEHPLVIVLYFPLVTVPAALPFVVRDFVLPRGLEWAGLLGVGVLAQVGQVALTRGMQHEPAGRATALSYLQVPFAALFGLLLFGNVPDAPAVLGAALVLLGSLLAAR